MTQITIPAEAISIEYSVTSPSTGPFVVPFHFFIEADVIAFVTDAVGTVTSLVVTTDFTFTQLDTPVGQEGSGFSGGEITLVSSIGADGDTTIQILRSIIIDRLANFPNTGPFSMPLLNDEQNRVIAIMQELAANQAGGSGGIPTLESVTTIGKTSTKGIELTAGADFKQVDATGVWSVTHTFNGQNYESSFAGVGNVQKWIIGNGLDPVTGAVRFQADVEFAKSGGGITTYFDNGLGAWVTLNQVADNFVIRAGLGTSKDIHLIPVAGGIVRIDGVISVKELFSSPFQIAGFGQWWVLVASPCEPIFTNDDGVDQLLDPSVSEINVQNGNYTTVITDKGKTISKESGGAGETFTIDSNANVAYKVGTFLAFNNDGGGDLTIAITNDTLIWADDNTTGSRTLGDGGYAVAQKVATTTWKIAGKQLS